MDRTDNLRKIVSALLAENKRYAGMQVPDSLEELQKLMRALMNVRMPRPLPEDVQLMQDQELQWQREEKGVVSVGDIPVSTLNPRLRLWQGDITRLNVDAIVNAANSQMLGCFIPLHRCIDNAIHSAAGLELREECHRIMCHQGHEEPIGSAKITPGYNLPAKWVIHTVGPVVYGEYPTSEDCRLLADCYRSCLSLAAEYHLESIAFCCISTGEFHFPNKEAAEIAVDTVTGYLADAKGTTLSTVIFNVFKDVDYSIYKNLLGYE